VRAWLPRVYGAALALTRRVSDAEDLTQEAFLKALRTSAAVPTGEAFGPWMLTIVRNAWIDRLRRPRRERALSEPDRVEAPEPGEAAGGVVALWRALPEDERLVCWLRLVAEVPFREIAELLSTSKSAVDRTFRRGLERLRGGTS
jgi:RNA polymerase sigma-70 factor (ECF subfamily)